MKRWLLLAIPIVLLLVPMLFEAELAAIAQSMIAAAQTEPLLVAGTIVLALAADVFLPVPNGVTNTLAGAIFGFGVGMVVIWTGLMAASLFGYGAGALAGQPLARKLLGDDDLAKAHAFAERLGPVALIVTRPVPMVAELASMAAGMARMPLAQFLTVMALSNLAVAAIFAAIGSAAIAQGSIWLTLLGAIGLPLLAWFAYQRFDRKARGQEPDPR